MVRQNRFVSARALTAQMRNLYGIRADRKTINIRLLSRHYRAYRPTRKPLLTANHRRLSLEWAQRWQNLTMAHWQHVIFGGEFRFQLHPVDGRLRVCRLHVPGERFQQRYQAYRAQAGGGSVHVCGAFHSGVKSPLALPDRYLTGELYRGISWNTSVPFARQHFGNNYHYQDNNATPYPVQVVLDFLQQVNITKMEQPARSPDCNPIDHIWDELGRAITSRDNPPRNLGELCQALSEKWSEIPVEHLQRLAASMLRCLVTIIAARDLETGIPDADPACTKPHQQARQHHAKHQVSLTRFTAVTIQWQWFIFILWFIEFISSWGTIPAFILPFTKGFSLVIYFVWIYISIIYL